MGYFSNGSEGLAYQDKYCSRCVHDINQNCQVWLAHLLYNSGKENQVLELLIPQNESGLGNEQCTMFIEKQET